MSRNKDNRDLGLDLQIQIRIPLAVFSGAEMSHPSTTETQAACQDDGCD